MIGSNIAVPEVDIHFEIGLIVQRSFLFLHPGNVALGIGYVGKIIMHVVKVWVSSQCGSNHRFGFFGTVQPHIRDSRVVITARFVRVYTNSVL